VRKNYLQSVTFYTPSYKHPSVFVIK